jgi:cold-inducible RNA-binding protein
VDTRLFVENLPPGTAEPALQALFGASGRTVVAVSIMCDRRTGESHNYGFVEMATHEDAEQAVQSLHGLVIRGCTLHVSHARARPR